MTLTDRLRWQADELIDLVLSRREDWWPRDLKLAVLPTADGDWTVRSSHREPRLAHAIHRAAHEVRANNAWDGY